MAIAKVITPQTDFSAGEFDIDVMRSDDPAMRIGGRTCSNFRILNTKKLADRPGRSARFTSTTFPRCEEVQMGPGLIFTLCFGVFGGSGAIQIRNASGVQVALVNGLAWDITNVNQIVWEVYRNTIYITFQTSHPRVLVFDGVSSWTLSFYSEALTGNQLRTPFYRLAPIGVTMQPSGSGGIISLTLSAPYFKAGHVNTRMRFCGRQFTITNVGAPTFATATVNESLPGSQTIGFVGDPGPFYSIGDEVQGSISHAIGIVTTINAGAGGNIVVQLLGRAAGDFGGLLTESFITTEIIIGPGGSLPNNTASAVGLPGAVTIWDEQVMDDFHGWPASCFVDQNRLGFCDFPALPGGISWSAIGQPTDMAIGPNPSDGFFELVPNKGRVLYVAAGPESSEFVFCDNGIYYIPISTTNPLKPGSVAFNLISRDGCSRVQPRAVQEVIVYIGSGGSSVMSLVAMGSYTRPYETRNLSDQHSHLIVSPVAIAAPTSADTFPERYAYVLNSDSTIAVLKYQIGSRQLLGTIGWTPWSGSAQVSWVSALNANVMFTSNYFGVNIVEVLDGTQYLDAAVLVNNPPPALVPSGGQGPLWWMPSQSVTLIDLGTRQMGVYQIDAQGFIVPQNIGGEDLASAQLVAGQAWTSTFEPFLPPVQGGQSVGQRMKRRKIAKWAVTANHGTGFVFADARVTAYRQDDDATQPPPLREETVTGRRMGRDYDPRVQLIKDVPGPLVLLEIGLDVTI